MKSIKEIKTRKELLEWAQNKRKKIIDDYVIYGEIFHAQLKEIEEIFNKKFGELK